MIHLHPGDSANRLPGFCHPLQPVHSRGHHEVLLPQNPSEVETLCGKDLDIEHLQLWVLSMAVVRAWSLQRRWRKPVLPCFSHMKVPAGWFPSGSLGGRPLRQRPTLPRGPPPPRPPSVSRTRGADAKKNGVPRRRHWQTLEVESSQLFATRWESEAPKCPEVCNCSVKVTWMYGPEVVGFDWLGDVGALFHTTCAGVVPDFGADSQGSVVDPTKQVVPLKVQVLPCHRLAPGGAATAGANLLVSARRLLAFAPALALSKARIPRHS